MELYKTDGTIATTYDYTPYGAVTAAGSEQPFQWSSEIYDAELGMVYYNYRHYNPMDGRWNDRDFTTRTDYIYCTNSPYEFYDLLGLVGIMSGPPESSNCLGGAMTNQINQDNLIRRKIQITI